MSSPSPAATRRLLNEFKALSKEPMPFIVARPEEGDILTWYYVIEGPPDSPYCGGSYLGRLRFPPEYPFAPPAIYMITPSGRFRPDSRLCLSMSDFHPKEWNPNWGPRTILTGLLSFMLEDEQTQGSVDATVEQRKALALDSAAFNARHPVIARLFPEAKASLDGLLEQRRRDALAEAAVRAATQAAASTAATALSLPPSDGAFAAFVHSGRRVLGVAGLGSAEAPLRLLQLVTLLCVVTGFWLLVAA